MLKNDFVKTIERFHLTSELPCWCTLNKRIFMISFVWDTNMAALSTVFCVSWDCVKTLYSTLIFFVVFKTLFSKK